MSVGTRALDNVLAELSKAEHMYILRYSSFAAR